MGVVGLSSVAQPSAGTPYTAAVEDEEVREEGTLLLGQDFHEVSLYLFGILVFSQA